MSDTGGRQGGGHEGERGLRSLSRAFALIGQLGLVVVSGGAVSALGGYALDGWLGTSPGFFLGGLLFGLAGGGVGAYRLIARYLED